MSSNGFGFPEDLEQDDFGFFPGLAQGFGSIGTILADVPFTLKQLADQAAGIAQAGIQAPVESLFGGGVDLTPEGFQTRPPKTFEELTQDIEEQRRQIARRGLIGRFVTGEEGTVNVKERLSRALSEATGFTGDIEQLVDLPEGRTIEEFRTPEGEIDVFKLATSGARPSPGGLGFGAGLTTAAIGTAFIPGLGGASEVAVEGGILRGLAKLGASPQARNAIVTKIGATGIANAVIGSPLTLSAARRPDGSIDIEELGIGLAADAALGAGFAGLGVGALKGGAAAIEGIGRLKNALGRKTAQVSQTLQQRKIQADVAQAEQARVIAAGAEQPLPTEADVLADLGGETLEPRLGAEDLQIKREAEIAQGAEPIDPELAQRAAGNDPDPETLGAIIPEENLQTVSNEQTSLFPDIQVEAEKTFNQLDNSIRNTQQTAAEIGEEVGQDIGQNSFLLDKTTQRGPLPDAAKVEEDVFFDKFVQPIHSRVKKINPEVAGALRKFEFRNLETARVNRNRVKPFLARLKTILPEDQKALKIALFNRENRNAVDILSKYGDDAVAEFSEVSKTLNDLFVQANTLGMDVGFLENYFPRMVRDHDKMLKAFGAEALSPFKKGWKEEAKRLGIKVKDLTPDQKTDVVNKLLVDQRRGTGRPGFAKGRVIEEINDRELFNLPGQKEAFTLDELYFDPDEALLKYVDKMAFEIEKRKFFGKGNDLSDSIGAQVARLSDEGQIRPQDEDKLEDLFKARFVNGVRAPGGGIGATRDLIYAGSIGNPLSAITQIGDLGLSAFKNGLFETLAGVVSKKRIKLQDIGLDDLELDSITAEMSDVSKTRKFLEKTLKTSGFKRMDKFMKETTINAALSRFQKDARKPGSKAFNKFVEEQRPVFGDELESVVTDLQNGVNSDNVRMLLFNRLSDTQPISLSEMPETYLNHPNGRIFYMLKSFTLKQLDLVRQDIIKEIGRDPINGLKQMTRFALYAGGANMTANTLKDFITGREIDLEDEAVDAILQTMGVSRFNIYRFRTVPTSRAVLDFFIPPTKIVDDVITDAAGFISGEQSNPLRFQSVSNIPVVGKPLFWRFGGGVEKEIAAQKRGAQEERRKVRERKKSPAQKAREKQKKAIKKERERIEFLRRGRKVARQRRR